MLHSISNFVVVFLLSFSCVVEILESIDRNYKYKYIITIIYRKLFDYFFFVALSDFIEIENREVLFINFFFLVD